MMQIIAFGHKSRQGKDQCCKFLDSILRMEGIKSRKVSFAAKLKEVCYQMFSWAGLKPGIHYESDEGAKERDVILPKVGMTPVDIWVKVGNHMRDIFGPIWIENALQQIPNVDVILISDLRFPNEAERIKELGGVCIKVVRPDVPGKDTDSDHALDSFTDWDDIIMNNSDLQMLNSAMEVLSYDVIKKHGK